jgi:NADH dehydrogenase [ubiquinone] 1 alpha subcomplex assembly factor 7
MSLKDRLVAEIHATGPMTVARYMTACLHDPRDGYYATRPALGEDGDFITAPMISQMFGELIGLWAAETWRGMGAPARVLLVEAGPGTGVLMHDALRAARLDPAFLAAAELWLIETSAPLAAVQRERLEGGPLAPHWAADLAGLPVGAPMILIANELLDCLPARQLVRTDTGWAERMVGLDETGALAFGLAPCDGPAPDLDAPPGAVIEVSEPQAAFASTLAERLVRDGGAALLIDYGRDRPGFGDTFQALRRHQKVDPLEHPGEADLTVHADFPAVIAAARAAGLRAGLLTQRDFLQRLGVEQRAAALSRARPDQADIIARQLARLIEPDQMGDLFKAACLYSGDAVPPGFEDVHA